MMPALTAQTPPNTPGADCSACPRLVAFRIENRQAHPDWFNAPVPSFGALDARLLVVGLAPGLKGANRTGRPFTGDWAGDLLYPSLIKFGFASGHFDARADDGLVLQDCRITNAVRCVPPQNKVIGAETQACGEYLAAEITAMDRLEAILALGTVAHGAVLAALGMRKSAHPFAHGASHPLENAPTLYNSYHCSRYNTNTGRLTPEMFENVLQTIKNALKSA